MPKKQRLNEQLYKIHLEYYQAYHVLVTLDYSPVYRVTVTYAACIQLCPPEDEHLMLETCRGE